MKQDNDVKHEITELLARVHKAGSEPSLSRAQKKRILSEILPRRSFALRFAPAGVALAAISMLLIGYPLVSASRPGTTLYEVKRTVEDAQSIVQPSFDNTLLKKRDDEIKAFTKKGDDKAVEKVVQEKKIIEDRIRVRTFEAGSSSGSSNTQQGNTGGDETDDEHEDDEHEGESSGGSSSGTSGSTAITRDSCRHELDVRKQAGENINSDAYKACDQYPH